MLQRRFCPVQNPMHILIGDQLGIGCPLRTAQALRRVHTSNHGGRLGMAVGALTEERLDPTVSISTKSFGLRSNGSVIAMCN